MIEYPEICLNVLKHLQDWRVRENFALTCRSVYNICLSETQYIPPIVIDLYSPTSITSFQMSTAKSLILNALETTQPVKVKASINQIISLLEALIRLDELTITALFNRRGIKKLINYLVTNRQNIKLSVPAKSYVYFHKRLFCTSTNNHKISLTVIIIPSDNISSSSEEDQNTLIKRKYDEYEVPVEVENSLLEIKHTLIKPYVDSGLAKLKQRRISNPFYLDLLIKRNIVSKNSEYQLLSYSNSPPLDQTCIISKPVHIETITKSILSTSNAFIESIICFNDNWLFVTQVDVFIRNDPEIDPCAIDTMFMSYPQTPVAKILQKSYKRTTWYEMVILYGRLELLVTGGIYGDLNTDIIKSFLGPNLHIKKPIDVDSASNIYTIKPTLSEDCIIKEERLLQNYSRRASNYKWGLRSARFCLKSFTTLNPLYTNITALECAASLILKCVAYNSFTIEDQVKIMKAIHAASSAYSLVIPRGQDDVEYLHLLRQNCNAKFKVVVTAAEQLINGLQLSHEPQAVLNGMLATSVYNEVIRYRCKLVNSSRVSNELFLM